MLACIGRRQHFRLVPPHTPPAPGKPGIDFRRESRITHNGKRSRAVPGTSMPEIAAH
jgi:hypothetical protein